MGRANDLKYLLRLFVFSFFLVRTLAIIFISIMKNMRLVTKEKLFVQIASHGHSKELGFFLRQTQSFMLITDNALTLIRLNPSFFIPLKLAKLKKIQDLIRYRWPNLVVTMQSDSHLVPEFCEIKCQIQREPILTAGIEATINRQTFYNLNRQSTHFDIPEISEKTARLLLSQGDTVIAKDRTTQGSAGVRILFADDTLDPNLDISVGNGYYFERLLTGKQFSIDCLVSQNKTFVYCAIRSFFKLRNRQQILPYLAFFGSTHLESEHIIFEQIATEISSNCQINSGPFNYEIILDNNSATVFDFGMRTGADWPFIYSDFNGENYEECLVNSFENKNIDFLKPRSADTVLIRAHPKLPMDLKAFLHSKSVMVKVRSGYNFHVVKSNDATELISIIEHYHV